MKKKIPQSMSHSINKIKFGQIGDKEIYLYELTNNHGNVVKICNYGGIVQSLQIHNRAGKMIDVVLGFDSLSEYVQHSPYFGCIVGRYANRIGNSGFKLDNNTYSLNANDGKHSLHGGLRGFDKVVWDTQIPENDHACELILTYLSPDGEENYPGNMNVRLKYTFTDDDELIIEYHATVDKPCPVNLTNHSYFNLAGEGLILDHSLQINAHKICVVDADLIPTGELSPIAGGDYDFIQKHRIGDRIKNVKNIKTGYDNNYVLDNYQIRKLREVALVEEKSSGLRLRLSTDLPGLQFYSGNFLDGSLIGKNSKTYYQYSGFCLETQMFPDSPNIPSFPNTVIRPGEKWQSISVYKFEHL
ncbi:MAG: aldose epimerase family protein [Bacteroidales bacterium]|nr:aldose epimerase family protein [Bacteroidales bacterium]